MALMVPYEDFGRLETCGDTCVTVRFVGAGAQYVRVGTMHDPLAHEHLCSVCRWPRAPEQDLGAGLTLDLHRGVALMEGAPVKLTATEYMLLEYLAGRFDQVCRNADILKEVWPDYAAGGCGERTGRGDRRLHIVRVNITRLRAKIGADRIETRPGIGYRLRWPA